MLSALIPSVHSYPAVHLVVKPVDQRYVQSGPLVLGSTPLKQYTPTADRDRPVSRMFLTYYYVHGLYHLPVGEIDVLAALVRRLWPFLTKSLRGNVCRFRFFE